MIQVVITSWWPLHKVDEIQKHYTKTQKEKGATSVIKSVSFYFSTVKEGGKIVSYHDIEEGKLEEALLFLIQFMATYHGIKGFSYEFSFAYTPEDIAAAQQS